MTDLEKVELAARRNAEAISKTVWMDEAARGFLSNAFFAFADEIRDMRRPSWEPDAREHAKIVNG